MRKFLWISINRWKLVEFFLWWILSNKFTSLKFLIKKKKFKLGTKRECSILHAFLGVGVLTSIWRLRQHWIWPIFRSTCLNFNFCNFHYCVGAVFSLYDIPEFLHTLFYQTLLLGSSFGFPGEVYLYKNPNFWLRSFLATFGTLMRTFIW